MARWMRCAGGDTGDGVSSFSWTLSVKTLRRSVLQKNLYPIGKSQGGD